MHRNSLLLFDRYARSRFKDGMRVLEIGPDRYPSTYSKLVGNSSITWETVDIISSHGLTHLAKSEYEFPVNCDSYDIVLSGQVIEHVRRIWVWVKELARVCKIGGQVITINPVNWPYHEHPVDCWRIYPEGMKALYEEAGLDLQFCRAESLEFDDSRFLFHESAYYRAPRRLFYRLFGIQSPQVRAVDAISIGVKGNSNCLMKATRELITD
jgi:SAM-dependent methyltransferase